MKTVTKIRLMTHISTMTLTNLANKGACGFSKMSIIRQSRGTHSSRCIAPLQASTTRTDESIHFGHCFGLECGMYGCRLPDISLAVTDATDSFLVNAVLRGSRALALSGTLNKDCFTDSRAAKKAIASALSAAASPSDRCDLLVSAAVFNELEDPLSLMEEAMALGSCGPASETLIAQFMWRFPQVEAYLPEIQLAVAQDRRVRHPDDLPKVLRMS